MTAIIKKMCWRHNRHFANQNETKTTNAARSSSVKPTCLWLTVTLQVRPLTPLWILEMTVDIWWADSSSAQPSGYLWCSSLRTMLPLGPTFPHAETSSSSLDRGQVLLKNISLIVLTCTHQVLRGKQGKLIYIPQSMHYESSFKVHILYSHD